MKNYIQRIIEEHDPEELCGYCIYGIDCEGGVTGGPNGPIYPPCDDSDPEHWFDIDAYKENKKGEIGVFEIEKVVYNNPATIVWFADGEKVVVKACNEPFDKEKGVAMAIARKIYPHRGNFKRIVESGKDQQPWIRD